MGKIRILCLARLIEHECRSEGQKAIGPTGIKAQDSTSITFGATQ